MIFNFKSTTDAKTLQGHGAEYFASLEEVNGKTNLTAESLKTSILAKAESLIGKADGLYNFYLSGSNYTGADLPHNNYCYSCASVFVRSSFLLVIVWGVGNLPPIVNGYDGSQTWKGWQTLATIADLMNYLPKSGGEVNGNVTIKTNGDTYRDFILKGANKTVLLRMFDDGTFHFHDQTNNKNIFMNWKDGTNTFNGTASGNLPLTGGALNGELRFKRVENGYGKIVKNHSSDVDYGLCIVDYDKDGNNVRFTISSKDDGLFLCRNGGADKTILHTGNSTKTVVDSTAPSDTTAIWVDTSA